MLGLILENKSSIVIYGSYALVFLSVFIIARMLFKEEENRTVQDNLQSQGKKSNNGFVNFARPFFNQYFTPMVAGKPFWDDKRKVIKRNLISAGLQYDFTPDEYLAFKSFNVFFFPIVAGLLTALDLIGLHWVLILGSGALGWFAPDFWVSGRITDRHKQIRKSMPFILDLLTLSTEAGLDFLGAIQKVVEKSKPSPFVDELEQVLKEIKVGSSRADAIREMAMRINMQEINSFSAILIASDQMGGSIGKILRQQSEQVRNQRFLEAEKQGGLAAQKLMLPIVLFMVPAVFILIIAPTFLGSGGGP